MMAPWLLVLILATIGAAVLIGVGVMLAVMRSGRDDSAITQFSGGRIVYG